MTAGKCETTRCGLCRFYSHEGRRGGLCHQLNVNVDSHWKACCLAESPFVRGVVEPTPVIGIAELVTVSTREASVVSLASDSVGAIAEVSRPLGKRIALSTSATWLSGPIYRLPIDLSQCDNSSSAIKASSAIKTSSATKKVWAIPQDLINSYWQIVTGSFICHQKISPVAQPSSYRGYLLIVRAAMDTV